jgi:hypothetical protein
MAILKGMGSNFGSLLEVLSLVLIGYKGFLIRHSIFSTLLVLYPAYFAMPSLNLPKSVALHYLVKSSAKARQWCRAFRKAVSLTLARPSRVAL